MDHQTKVHTLAHMLAHGHGGTAPFVAVARARECREARDYASALLWLEVALLAEREVPEDGDAEISAGACHDALVTLLHRRRHHRMR
jgi:hypothetical protein